MIAKLLAALRPIPPAEMPALILIMELEADPPSASELVERQPEIKATLEALEALGWASERVVERCWKLEATASPSVPTGF